MRSVPFGAPQEVNDAQRKICSSAAKLANMQLRQEFLSEDNALTRMLAQQKKKSLQVMRSSWSPLISDWHYGFALRVRDSDTKWLVTEEFSDRLQEIVTDSMTAAVMMHQQDWIGPALNDVLVSEVPYYRMSDTPGRIQRLWNRLRKH